MRPNLRGLLSICALAVCALAAGCEAPPVVTQQTGFRGTGMAEIENAEMLAYLREANQIPPPPFELSGSDTSRVADLGIYQNVQVLGDVSGEEFNHLMLSITEWVVPKVYRDDPNNAGGCNYCHNPANMASDEVYTKVVARRMIQMTRAINTDWQAHVRNTGVTCYTCHRGQAIPAAIWTLDPSASPSMTLAGNKHGQNTPAEAVGYASLPYDIFAPYIEQPEHKQIRVQGDHALPSGAGVGTKTTEQTYGLMMHMSNALGVNCTYCHNSRAWSDWNQSSPQRVTAWHGLAMVRAVNAEYITPLASVFPAARKGPLGDVYKTNCTTCHQGVAKPLYGVSMLPDHPALARNPAYIQAASLSPDMAATPGQAESGAAGQTGAAPANTAPAPQ